ncbi:MAG: hypothetical protein LWW81_15710, partial [Rhodocyclales bacterium]|nr:hypothetical protein [Rhodocyclales bacterium]
FSPGIKTKRPQFLSCGPGLSSGILELAIHLTGTHAQAPCAQFAAQANDSGEEGKGVRHPAILEENARHGQGILQP